MMKGGKVRSPEVMFGVLVICWFVRKIYGDETKEKKTKEEETISFSLKIKVEVPVDVLSVRLPVSFAMLGRNIKI